MTTVEAGIPAYSLCHSRKLLAGIQCFFLLSPFIRMLCMGKPLDSRLKTSGMTEGTFAEFPLSLPDKLYVLLPQVLKKREAD